MRLRIKSKNLSFKIILVIVILLFPMTCYMIYSAEKSQEIIIGHTITNMENIANLYLNELEDDIESINVFVMNMEQNDQNLLILSDQSDRDTCYIAAIGVLLTMREHMAVKKDADLYYFYSEFLGEGMSAETSDTLTKKQIERVIFSSDEIEHTRKWQFISIEDTKWMLHVNFWGDLLIGSGIQLDSFEQVIRDNIAYETVQIVMDDKPEIEIPKGYLAVTRQCMDRGIYLHILIEKEEVLRNLPFLQRIGYMVALIHFMMIPIMILVLQILVLKPLKTINIALHGLKKNSAVRIEGKANTNDFENVYHTFNEMADQIVELKIMNYEQELYKQQIELRNLQLQVKPHFLFNSLNLMYNLVAMHEYKSVQKMLLYLSDYFRYINVGDYEFALFQEELELIEKYMEIGAIRYPNAFVVDYEIDDAVREVEIPQLLVHNFVENIIKHGLDLKRINHIKLKAYVEDSKAVFYIIDDGVGMEKEQAENINKGMFRYSDQKNHLGLKNSWRRIHYYYGEQGEMLIKSELGKGTTVILNIPVTHSKESEWKIGRGGNV